MVRWYARRLDQKPFGKKQMHYRAYDIRHRLVQADTKRLLHRNAPHRDGDRYVIVRALVLRSVEPLP